MIKKTSSGLPSLTVLLINPEHDSQLMKPIYRYKQLVEWLIKPSVQSIDQFSNYPIALRNHLKAHYSFSSLRLEDKQISKDGTRRYVFKCVSDDEMIEAVYIPTSKRGTLCLSTQVGCALGCRFCASGVNGLKRHLTTNEIIDQVRYVLQEDSLEVTHLVFMGIGEPLHNYEAVGESISIFNQIFGIGMRRITVSTSGLVPQIMQLAEDFPQVGLAISLHSAIDTKRTEIMPINKKYNIESLMKAVRSYIGKTNKKVTFEYTLMRDVNDQEEDVNALSYLIKGLLCRVNVIPMNSHDMSSYQAPEEERLSWFVESLQKRGLQVVIRRPRGRDIDAACGQLRLRQLYKVKK